MTKLVAHTGKRGQPKRIGTSSDLRMIDTIPPVPDYFQAEAADLWNETCEVLISRGDLAEGDLPIVELYAHNFEVFRDASRRLADEGLTVEKQTGIVAHPLVGVRKQAETQMSLAALQLGLTPRARRDMKIAATPKDHSDKTGGF